MESTVVRQIVYLTAISPHFHHSISIVYYVMWPFTLCRAQCGLHPEAAVLLSKCLL